METFISSASVICADLGNLKRDMNDLKDAGCEELHFSIMDGTFGPDICLGFDFIKMAKESCGLPCNACLSVERPERFIDRCIGAGSDIITLQVETCMHMHRALTYIREAGVSPGIVINPATPLIKVEYLLGLVDRIVLMNTEVGFEKQKPTQGAFERVRILKQSIDYLELPVKIEVCGNLDVDNAAMMLRHGANILVLDKSNVFENEVDLCASYKEFLESVARETNLV